MSKRKVSQKANKKEAMREFEEIVSRYIKPLFDVRGTPKMVEETVNNTEWISVEDRNGKTFVSVFPCIGIPSPFHYEMDVYSSLGLKKPAGTILWELIKVAEYGYRGDFFVKQRDYGKGEARQSAYKKRTLDLAFELGMCSWLAGKGNNAQTLYSIVCRMIEWSERTYEGKKVPFGIVIDFETTAHNDSVSYLHFLENDSSAVFTDGIFSGILLDRTGRLVSFLSRNTFQAPLKKKDVFVPYQFADIAQYCTGKAVGIIALTNGEILLIKDRAIQFAKRGSKWVYFDWARVNSCLRPYFLECGNDEIEISNKIKTIYCTLLDVSFSHTGGCLALINPKNALEEKIGKIIKDRFDLYIGGTVPSEISKESKEKIEILKYLLYGSGSKIRSFFEIEKPLRKEILSLDGATVVSLDGSFYCAGSIVSVPGGSSGGGRTAAAKRLAQIGVGIKISEDGYIEAYGVPLNIEANGKDQTRIERLFAIR